MANVDVCWDDLPEALASAFAGVRTPPRVAEAIIGYLQHRRLIRKRGQQVLVEGRVLLSNRVSTTLRDVLHEDVKQSYVGLSQWIAYFFKPLGSHGPGIDIDAYSRRAPSVAGQAVGAQIKGIAASYRLLLQNTPELAEFAYEIIGHLFSCHWALFEDVVRPLEPSERALLATGVDRWDQFPSPSSSRARAVMREGETTESSPFVEAESEGVRRVDAARRRVVAGMREDPFGTVRQLSFEVRHSREIGLEWCAGGRPEQDFADDASDYAALASIVAADLRLTFDPPSGRPLEALNEIEAWLAEAARAVETRDGASQGDESPTIPTESPSAGRTGEGTLSVEDSPGTPAPPDAARHPLESVVQIDPDSRRFSHVGLDGLFDAPRHRLSGSELRQLTGSKAASADDVVKGIMNAIKRDFPEARAWLHMQKAGSGKDAFLELREQPKTT